MRTRNEEGEKARGREESGAEEGERT